MSVAQARVAAVLLLTLRGTPTMYYGDEIGMRDVPIPSERVQDPFEKREPGKGNGRDPERSPELDVAFETEKLEVGSIGQVLDEREPDERRVGLAVFPLNFLRTRIRFVSINPDQPRANDQVV